MDDQGWVPIKLIAGFKKGDQVRKRIDWMRWIMPPSVHFPTKSGQDTLAARVQNISLDQRAANQSGASNPEDSDAGRPSYGDFSNQPQLFNNVLMVGQQVIETICYFPNLPNCFPLFFSFFTNGDVGFSFTICYW
ncbi:hypothetical protein ES332_A02G089200v1 [Gossypium tomentosum]|uniref:HTH La-type RNA-binding domain-containing protein n=1 Tax=Gossypium tomentosum TaxID=34277 RepID=A0A5D2RFQ6_GOSTO|nr:hypothetical protein ES332_A02G089200v1 [Gossypium tomentosum]